MSFAGQWREFLLRQSPMKLALRGCPLPLRSSTWYFCLPLANHRFFLSIFFFFIFLCFSFFSCSCLTVYVSVYLLCVCVCQLRGKIERRRKSNSVATDPFICLNKYCSDNVPKDDGLRKIRDISEGWERKWKKERKKPFLVPYYGSFPSIEKREKALLAACLMHRSTFPCQTSLWLAEFKTVL